ncbi:H(+)/Cl(-) exchange transporter 6-like isoform X1 [Lethenteron reissneri]|uniref:H(+)/Cl(-) exchange transporter 6-like isoform X1 n=1 Tax=Lethenteron reissneri TaxID=7753 RepID=UPI002AB7436C|nr:H(+)/Cl(-) exchange transporter 6-like isoform X1 [Lethenteron reissneri]
MERADSDGGVGIDGGARGFGCCCFGCGCCGDSPGGSRAAARTPEELAELCDDDDEEEEAESGGGGGRVAGGAAAVVESLERRDAWPSALQAEHEERDDEAGDDDDDEEEEGEGGGEDEGLTKGRTRGGGGSSGGSRRRRRVCRACLTRAAHGLCFPLLGAAVAAAALLLVWLPARLAWALPRAALDGALRWSEERGALALLLLLGAAVRGALALGAALAGTAAVVGGGGSGRRRRRHGGWGEEEEEASWLLRDGVRDAVAWTRGAVAVRGLGAACASAGGLVVGIEAPMLHVGTALGLWLPSLLCPALSRAGLRPAALCTARGRRCLAAAGSAAGMALAFGAPLAGAVFGLQNAGPGALADPGVVFPVLLSSVTASLAFSALSSGALALSGAGGSPPAWPVGMLDLAGESGGRPAGGADPWALLPAAMALGAVGGVHAAAHRRLRARLSRYRARHVFAKPPCAGALEALLVSLAGSCAAFLAAAALGSCRDDGGAAAAGNATAAGPRDPRALLPSLLCPNGTANDLARLLLSAPETALRGLLGPGAAPSPPSLLMALGCLAPLSLWASGLRAPGGAFAPQLLVGAVYGRLAAGLLRRWQPRRWPPPRQDKLALAGAAAALGGVARWPLVLALALVEASGADAEGAAAALLALLLSGWLAGAWSREPARAAAALRGLPLLPDDSAEPLPPPAPGQRCQRLLLVSDVMEPELVYVYPHTRVQSLVSVLRARRHHAFPVVTEAAGASHGGAGNAALLAANGEFHRAALAVTRANEYRRRSRSMRSYPSAELQRPPGAGRGGVPERRRRDDDDEGDEEESSPACEYLASVLQPGVEPYPNLQPAGWASGDAGDPGRAADAGLPGDWTLAQRLRPLTYHGMVSRSRLAALLARGAWYEEGRAPARQPRVGAATLAEAERRGLDVGDLELALLEPRAVVDVTPYVDAGAPAVNARASAGEALRVMAALQARQLAVVNAAGHVVGVVTRHELTPEALRRSLRRKRMARP